MTNVCPPSKQPRKPWKRAMGSNYPQHSVALLVLSVASLALGYHVGRRSLVPQINRAEEQIQEALDEADDGDLSAINPGLLEPCKLVLIVRTDLKMGSGTISAQHATLACYKTLVKRNPQLVKHWERTGQAKIALKAGSEKQLSELESLAKSLNLCARSVPDHESTQGEPRSRAILAIGPAPIDVVNRVTGKLRLL
ncbi:peptidyl-tRNA hydrolase PTH2-domain-containing protein [Mycena crocata]|nr:peptidyl-tRNA hydrolase PTH2-domain-containing protein [Mycena crocata]